MSEDDTNAVWISVPNFFEGRDDSGTVRTLKVTELDNCDGRILRPHRRARAGDLSSLSLKCDLDFCGLVKLLVDFFLLLSHEVRANTVGELVQLWVRSQTRLIRPV